METKAKPYEERDAREAEGKGDRWSEMQEANAPEINLSFVGFEIETLFEYSDDNGGHLSNWYFRRIAEIVMRKLELSELNGMILACVMVIKWKQSRSSLRQNGIWGRWGRWDNSLQTKKCPFLVGAVFGLTRCSLRRFLFGKSCNTITLISNLFDR